MVYNTIVLSFGLLIVIVLPATLAIRIRVPYAVVLVIGGIGDKRVETTGASTSAAPIVSIISDLVLLRKFLKGLWF